MCIAIFVPKGKIIGKKTLKRCYEANSDGFGYAYFNNDKRLIVRKFVGEENIKREIRNFYELRNANLDKQFMIHFRIATHGAVGVTCCHPFVVNRKTVFCHNGVLGTKFTNGLSKTGDMSDTMMFNKLCLQKLPKNFMDKKLYKFLLESAIDYSKMIIMNSNDKVWILNERLGEWDGGIWYSNTTYKKQIYYFDDTDFGYGYDYGCGVNNNAYTYNSKTKRYEKTKKATKASKVYDIDDWDDYKYSANYGTKGWSNFGNGYATKEKENFKSNMKGIGVEVDESGNVVTAKDKEENNK